MFVKMKEMYYMMMGVRKQKGTRTKTLKMSEQSLFKSLLQLVKLDLCPRY